MLLFGKQSVGRRITHFTMLEFDLVLKTLYALLKLRLVLNKANETRSWMEDLGF